jgi:uroporphyrinogen decarboxylase
MDLRKARAVVGDRMCLMGNIDIEHVLRCGAPRDVDAAVRDAVEAADGGPFILSTSDGILEQTPLANVRAYFSAARRHGCCFGARP